MERQTLYSDKYLDVYYNQDLRLIEYYWKEATEDMTEAEYRMILLDLTDEVDEKVKSGAWMLDSFLLDNQNFLFVMSPKLQEWHTRKITSVATTWGAKKVAIVMSEEFASQMSIEQTMEEDKKANSLTRYFDNMEEAKEWL